MATPKLLLSGLLRRCRPTPAISYLSSSSSSSPNSNSFFMRSPHPSDPSHNQAAKAFNHCHHFTSFTLNSLAPYNLWCYHSFSTRHDSEYGGLKLDDDSIATQSGLLSELGFSEGGGGLEVAETVASITGQDSIFPVRAFIWLLDGFHELVGLPWWITIIFSSLALRIALLPVFVLQLQTGKRIAELSPKLPPPLPPPLSGRSYIDQFLLFRKERRAVGCPSYLWMLTYFVIQFPCFLLAVASIRRMSLEHHPGFYCGGTLWFQNLTEFPDLVPGAIFPLAIACVYCANVQISFQKSLRGKKNGPLDFLFDYYRFYLNLMTIPVFVGAFFVPQGSLVFWLTNSTLSFVQHLSLHHPAVIKKLGLKDAPLADAMELSDPPRKLKKISVQNLSPRELIAFSVQLLAKGHKDRAIPLLRLALDKDPDYVRALILMGQTLLQNGLAIEAVDYLERAISKLLLVGYPTEAEDVDLLILASQWAGVAFVRQGKWAEGIVHLERVASFKEPENSKSKDHYYDGLVLLASALCNKGRKTEAVKYLRMAAAYNSDYKVLLEQCENDDDNFVSDLVHSRRKDY